jgi:hypothetical protein
MNINSPEVKQRLRDAMRFLPLTLIILVVSKILFDLLAGREMFWSSEERLVSMLWSSLLTGPFIMFALLVSAQRNQSRN